MHTYIYMIDIYIHLYILYIFIYIYIIYIDSIDIIHLEREVGSHYFIPLFTIPSHAVFRPPIPQLAATNRCNCLPKQLNKLATWSRRVLATSMRGTQQREFSETLNDMHLKSPCYSTSCQLPRHPIFKKMWPYELINIEEILRNQLRIWIQIAAVPQTFPPQQKKQHKFLGCVFFLGASQGLPTKKTPIFWRESWNVLGLVG